MNFEIVIPAPDKQMPWDEELYSTEIGYGGTPDRTMVGTVNHESKAVRPCHGYYAPHPTGKRLKKYAKVLGYEYKG